MKKIYYILLLCLVACSCCNKTKIVKANLYTEDDAFENVPYDFRVGEFCYKKLQNREVSVVIDSGKNVAKRVVPNTVTYRGITYTVTELGENVFLGDSMVSIILPRSLKKINDEAFHSCGKLSSIFIPASVKEFEINVFAYTDHLSAIKVDKQNKYFSSVNGVLFSKDKRRLIMCPEGKTGKYSIPSFVSTINACAFSSCNLTSITIPNSIINISESAFELCKKLEFVKIPNSVTSISDYAFNGCISLKSVIIGKTIKHIGNYAFQKCNSLTSITIPNSVTHIGAEAFCSCKRLRSATISGSVRTISFGTFAKCSKLEDVNIKEGVICVDSEAFHNCYLLANIKIPKSVKEIKGEAFFGCIFLKNIQIPQYVRSIGGGAFGDCIRLKSIFVEKENRKYSSREGILYNKNGNILVQYPAGLKDKSFAIPNTVNSIFTRAFLGCHNLNYISISNTVTKIGAEAFRGCRFKTITIPSSVTSLGFWLFKDNEELTSITNLSLKPQESGFLLPNCDKEITLHVRKGCKDIYYNTPGWQDFKIVDDIK